MALAACVIVAVASPVDRICVVRKMVGSKSGEPDARSIKRGNRSPDSNLIVLT
jgi:hypothetical protein